MLILLSVTALRYCIIICILWHLTSILFMYSFCRLSYALTRWVCQMYAYFPHMLEELGTSRVVGSVTRVSKITWAPISIQCAFAFLLQSSTRFCNFLSWNADQGTKGRPIAGFALCCQVQPWTQQQLCWQGWGLPCWTHCLQRACALVAYQVFLACQARVSGLRSWTLSEMNHS